MQESFEGFVSTWGGRLLGTAVLMTGDRAEAEDLLQDVLERLYPRWERIDDPLAYTRTAMSRALTDRWRRAGRRPRQVPLGERHDRAVTDGATERAARSEIVEHLRRLPPRQRAVIVLRYFEDWSEEKVADELDIARGTVKSQTAKGMATLRRLLGEHDTHDGDSVGDAAATDHAREAAAP
ncbi:SigE family RNA polymerase sigma factor [Kineococcus sp. TBRC 1896]|uniref:SigE family RNA polymerase sigma factor n=1 Tax=Kineococcus mangrovi TaxID=1660183 RepID=A0ABV4HYK1_9ACTN